MAIDYEKYIHHLDCEQLTHERKVEIVGLVHQVLQSQIDQIMGVHPVQCCGYDQKGDSHIALFDQHSKGTAANDNNYNAKESA